MFAHEIDFGETLKKSYEEVVLKRRTCRSLDPNYVVPREEILQIITEATSFIPSGANAQPYRFLIIDKAEDKKKLDGIMRGVDVGRVLACSFVLIPMYDRDYILGYDELMEINQKMLPEKYTPDHVAALKAGVANAAAEMRENGGIGFERFLSYEVGLATMATLLVIRAHDLDSGFATDWHETLFGELFDIDMERYQPLGPICVGKNIGPVYDCFRYEAEDQVIFIG